MSWLRRLAAAVALIVALAVAYHPARASIDDDWALIDSCAKLRAFQTNYGPRNRYTPHVAARARQLGCPATPRRTEKVEPREPRRNVRTPRDQSAADRRAPAGRDYVLLAPSGGDTSDFSAALRMVKPGGLITVHPGRYSVSADIPASVRIEGLAGRWSDTVMTGSMRVSPGATDVRLANLTFQAGAPGNFLTVFGKFSCDACDLRSEYAQSDTTVAGIPVFVAGAGEIHLLNSRIVTRGSCANPNATCYALSFNVYNGNRSTIVNSFIDHQWSAIYHWRGNLFIWNTRLEGLQGGAIFKTSGSGTLEIADSRFISSDNSRSYTIEVSDTGGFSLRNNSFKAKAPQNLLYAAGVQYRDISLYPGRNFLIR